MALNRGGSGRAPNPFSAGSGLSSTVAWYQRSIRLGGLDLPLLRLFLFLGLAYATLAVGSVFTRIDAWYDGLAKPSWTPPGVVIGIVWTILYTLIGIASALAWTGSDDRVGRRLFGVLLGANLALNASWSMVFFTLHRPGAAVAEIAVLAVSTIVLAAAAFTRVKTAGYLLTPYVVWVVFAGFLNYTIWRMNA